MLYNLRSTETTTSFDDIDFIDTGLPIDADFETDSSQLYGGLSLTYDATRLSHRLSFTRADFDNENKTSAPVNSETNGTKDQIQYQVDWITGIHTLTSILEYEEEEYRQRGEASFFGDPNRDLNADTKSIALEYRLNGESLNLSLSARHDENSDFDNSNPWRATLAWHLGNDQTSLSASVGESSKNPTFTERFGFFDTFVGNPDLKPEQSLSWEIGIRQSLREEELQLTGTWFSAKLENEINGFVFDPALGVFTAKNVSGESHRKGLELAVDYRPINKLVLAANYTYLDATEEDPSGNDVIEVRRPEHSGTVSASYSWSQVNFDIALTYTGDQEDLFFPPRPPYQERVVLDSYLITTVTGSYRLNDKIELTLRLENAFDENYEEVYGFASPGFAAYGGLRIAW
jgi:vitamin B12 transporter